MKYDFRSTMYNLPSDLNLKNYFVPTLTNEVSCLLKSYIVNRTS